MGIKYTKLNARAQGELQLHVEMQLRVLLGAVGLEVVEEWCVCHATPRYAHTGGIVYSTDGNAKPGGES
jgi:hypothetical protein